MSWRKWDYCFIFHNFIGYTWNAEIKYTKIIFGFIQNPVFYLTFKKAYTVVLCWFMGNRYAVLEVDKTIICTEAFRFTVTVFTICRHFLKWGSKSRWNKYSTLDKAKISFALEDDLKYTGFAHNRSNSVPVSP